MSTFHYGRHVEIKLTRHFREIRSTLDRYEMQGFPGLLEGAAMIMQAFSSGNKLLICGEGGGAESSQQLATRFASRLRTEFEKSALPAIALSSDSSFAAGKDHEPSDLFANQVKALGNKGDVLLVVSTNDHPESVQKTIASAKEYGIKTLGLLGWGDTLEKEFDVTIVIPALRKVTVQAAMLPIQHLLCELVEEAFFDNQGVDHVLTARLPLAKKQ